MRNKMWLGLLMGVVVATSSAVAGAAERYKIDPSHSFVMFKISHLGFSVLNGRFNELAGEFTYDPAKPGASKINVTVQTASVDSNWAERDKHLRSPDFLNVGEFPTATFETTGYSESNGQGTLTGNLTLHGVTRPITVAVQAVGAGKDPWGGFRRGYTGTAKIKRGDFGISYNLGPTAEEMELNFVVEGVRQ